MTVETKKLLFRELTMNDIESLHKFFSKFESMKHYLKPLTIEEAKKWIKLFPSL